MNKYGPFCVILYSRIKEKGMFEIPEHGDFLLFFTAFYFSNIKNASVDIEAHKQIQMLVSVIPPFRQLKELKKFHETGGLDMIFFKVCLDILCFYSKITGGPLFTKYTKEVIPFARRFYEKLSPSAIQGIHDELKLTINKSTFFIKPFHRKHTLAFTLPFKSGIREILLPRRARLYEP